MQSFKIAQWILLLILFATLTNSITQEEHFFTRFHQDQMLRKHHTHPTQGLQNITVHLIPHSHDDVGWLKTVDEYYYGDRQDIQWAAVQYVYDTVVDQLTQHPNYKFVVVEMAFLYRWWRNADVIQKERFKKLIKNGQLQFINGGWCMSDQATPYYEDVIDQMTVGLRWLNQTFNYIPDIAWHIDPFGHQASSASMFSQMGMQAFFFARIDYQDKEKRMEQKNLEMIWRPHQTVPQQNNYIFTHVNYYLYAAPPGFNFDSKWLNQPIKDDKTMQDYNIESRADEYVQYFKSMSLHYKSKHLMHTIGGDFQYSNARQWFKNMDKLTGYINKKTEYGVTFKYSTPDEYIKQIHSQQINFQTKTDDFFPYADQQHAYWTGYFTSRIAFKGFVRDFGRWIQSVRKYISECRIRNSQVLKNKASEFQEGIWDLETSIGIMQHHDAVSGTEKQRVAQDYIATALRSINKFKPLYQQLLKEQISSEVNQNLKDQQIVFNIFWNETAKQTGISDLLNNNKTVLLILYNSGPSKTQNLKISVPPLNLKVIDQNNQNINGDVFCVSPWDSYHCQLSIRLNFPQSANKYIKIVRNSDTPTAKIVNLKELTLIQSSKGFNLTSTAYLKVTKSSGKMDLVMGNRTQSFSIHYNYYQSYQGDGQKSGAYIFRPSNNTPKKFSSTKTFHFAEGTQGVYLCFEGDRVINKIFFSKAAGQIQQKGIQIESRIGSIPIEDKIGKQVTMNIQTNHNNNKKFYTDSNGLEQQQRIFNFRPTWNLSINQEVAGNYYPVNSHIGFQDQQSKQRITVLTDRSQGGSIIRKGQIQLMLHRRLLQDDVRGVNEPLNQLQPSDHSKGLIQNVRHYIVFGSKYRQLQVQNDQKVQINFVQSSKSDFDAVKIPQPPIKVPKGVKLYLRPDIDGSYLLRIQNFNYQKVSFDLPYNVAVNQMTLSANQLKATWQLKQYKWNKNVNDKNQVSDSFLAKLKNVSKNTIDILNKFLEADKTSGVQTVQLNFLEIRTYKAFIQ